VSFLTMGKVFCALATGNVLFLSFGLAGEGDVPVARPAIAIGAFMAGAAVAGVVLTRLAERRRPWFPVGLVREAVLLVPLGTGRALLIIAAAVLLLTVVGMVAPSPVKEPVPDSP
jgi:uncharacterized membrane protein YoaK (UPF0700 family)